MKTIIRVIILLQSIIINAQEAPKPIKYEAKVDANVFYYDISEVIEKLKIKKQETEKATQKELRVYNNKVSDISFLNFQKFQELEILVNSVGNDIVKQPDLRIELRKKMDLVILPIRDSIHKNEQLLNNNLNTILSKSQFKKWIKYQKKKKENLRPKPSRNNNSQSTSPPPNRSNRRRM